MIVIRSGPIKDIAMLRKPEPPDLKKKRLVQQHHINH